MSTSLSASPFITGVITPERQSDSGSGDAPSLAARRDPILPPRAFFQLSASVRSAVAIICSNDDMRRVAGGELSFRQRGSELLLGGVDEEEADADADEVSEGETLEEAGSVSLLTGWMSVLLSTVLLAGESPAGLRQGSAVVIRILVQAAHTAPTTLSQCR